MSWCPNLIVKPVSNRFMVDLDKQNVSGCVGMQREEKPSFRTMHVSQNINWNLLDGKNMSSRLRTGIERLLIGYINI